MAIEQKWAAIPFQALTSDGLSTGDVPVLDSTIFKVKQSVILFSDTKQPIIVQVKRINSPTSIIVGLFTTSIKTYLDVSDFTLVDNAKVYAEEQSRPSIIPDAYNRAVYEEEPTVAVRTFQVDALGNKYTKSNPFPVQLSDGSINIETLNAELRVQLSAKDDDPTAGDIHSSVRVGGQSSEGSGEVSEAVVNTDGSFNVRVVNPEASSLTRNVQGDAIVVPDLQTDIVTYTVPVGKTAIVERVTGSGQQIGRFDLFVNSMVVDTQRSYYGGFNVSFEFGSAGSGFKLNANDVITLKVTQGQQDPGDFNGRLQIIESV